jgi:L-threonylcarbamoyladenylate synthase
VSACVTHWWNVPTRLSVERLRERDEIREAARLLREGGLVAFPTETVYGLGANATDDRAVARIFAAKGRPDDNPLIVHIGRKEEFRLWGVETETATRLIERFWPGPLTLVVPLSGAIAPNVTAGLSTVAIRMPSHPVALALLQEAGVPVAAPSANRSGRPSPTEGRHVWQDLSGRIDVLLDGGPTGVGVESTVLDLTGKVPVLLRPGGVTLEELEEAAGPVHIDPGLLKQGEKPRSPGMKYRHYAPEGEMWLVAGEEEKVRQRIREMTRQARREGRKVGVLTTEESRDLYDADVVVACGQRSNPASVASRLYAALRRFDEERVDLILAETFPETGLFRSVMNRLHKAANGNVIRV